MNRQQLIQFLKGYFKGELIVLSSQGYANILTFQSSAHLKLVKDEDMSNLVSSIAQVAKKVISETKDINMDKSTYTVNLAFQTAEESVSVALQKLLSCLSQKFDNHSLPALLIGNIVTGVLRNQRTDLEVSLGVLFRE